MKRCHYECLIQYIQHTLNVYLLLRSSLGKKQLFENIKCISRKMLRMSLTAVRLISFVLYKDDTLGCEQMRLLIWVRVYVVCPTGYTHIQKMCETVSLDVLQKPCNLYRTRSRSVVWKHVYSECIEPPTIASVIAYVMHIFVCYQQSRGAIKQSQTHSKSKRKKKKQIIDRSVPRPNIHTTATHIHIACMQLYTNTVLSRPVH